MCALHHNTFDVVLSSHVRATHNEREAGETMQMACHCLGEGPKQAGKNKENDKRFTMAGKPAPPKKGVRYVY